MSIESPEPTPRRRRNYSNIGIEPVSYAEYMAEAAADHESLYDGEMIQLHRTLGGKLRSQRSHIAQMPNDNKREMATALTSETGSRFVQAILNRALTAAQEEGVIRGDDSPYPPFDLSNPKEQYPPNTSEIFEAMTHQRATKRYIMPNHEFLNVLQWYVANGPDPHADFEVSRAEKHKENYEERLIHAVKRGILPEAALERLALLDHTPILVNDGSDGSDLYNRGQFTHWGDALIQSTIVGTPHEEGVTFHELSHALSMVGIVEKKSLIPEIIPDHAVATRAVGLETVFKGELHRTFNEGLTEMTTEALLGGARANGAYVDQRNLIIALCECSQGNLTGMDFAKAYFASVLDHDNGGTNAATELRDAISQTYPKQITDALTAMRRDFDHERTVDGQLTDVSKITVELYLEWSRQHARTPEQAEWVAERIMNASEGLLNVEDFLTKSAATLKSK